MDIEVTEKKDNPLLSRTEVWFSVKYEGATPKFSDVRDALTEKLKSKKELTIVDNVVSEYGRQKAHGYAKIYETEEAVKVETDQKIKKNLEGKKTKDAAEAPEAASAAKTSEEKPAEKESKAEEAPAEKEAEAEKAPAEQAGQDKEDE